MDWSYFRKLMRLLLGILLLLFSMGLFLYNPFLSPRPFDLGLGLLTLYLFVAGLLLTIFAAASLPSDRR